MSHVPYLTKNERILKDSMGEYPLPKKTIQNYIGSKVSNGNLSNGKS